MQRIPFVDLKAQFRLLAPEIDQAIHEVVSRADFVLGEAVEKFEEEFHGKK